MKAALWIVLLVQSIPLPRVEQSGRIDVDVRETLSIDFNLPYTGGREIKNEFNLLPFCGAEFVAVTGEGRSRRSSTFYAYRQGTCKVPVLGKASVRVTATGGDLETVDFVRIIDGEVSSNIFITKGPIRGRVTSASNVWDMYAKYCKDSGDRRCISKK